MKDEITSPFIKLGTVWAAVGITSWTDVAACLAALYSLCLLGELVWKWYRRAFPK